MLMQHVKEGKLAIIGNTGSQAITIDDMTIPSVPNSLKVPGFNGISMILTHADMDEKKALRMKTLLWNALQDPATKQVIKNLYLQPDATDNQIFIDKYIKSEQAKAREFLISPVSIFQ